jgi:hypothetical protein
MSNINFDNFQPEEYVKTCNWFDLKNAYYDEFNKDDKSQTTTKLATALKKMDVFRKKSIKLGMSVVFGGESLPCEFTTKPIDELFNKKYESQIKKLNLGGKETVWIFLCSGYIYVVTSFGSSTLTSDFDFSVFRVDTGKFLDLPEHEISNIQQTTVRLNALDKYIKEQICHEESMQKCFDSNGYPEIMVFYNQYFKNLNLAKEDNLKEARYANVVSSKIVRFCIVSQIYIGKTVNVLANPATRSSFYRFFSRCFEKLSGTTRKLITLNKGSFDLEESEVLKDRPFGSRVVKRTRLIDQSRPSVNESEQNHVQQDTIIDDFGKNLISYNVPNKKEQRDYILNGYKIFEFFTKDVENPKLQFKRCIQNFNNPTHFMEKLYQKSKNKIIEQYRNSNEENVRVFYHNKMMYYVYDEFFYLPEDYTSFLSPMTNRLILPFLGACHIWADEAYVTFGALEFVKKEKQILHKPPQTYLSCDSLIETYYENMGMMLFHIYEEGHEKEILNEKVKNYQSISDAYSKYLRRALLVLDLKCTNDFGVRKRRFYIKGNFIKNFKSNAVWKFFDDIKSVVQDNNKKMNYFKFFKRHFSTLTVKKLITNTLDFYFRFSSRLLRAYDETGLYKFKKKKKARVDNSGQNGQSVQTGQNSDRVLVE